MNDELISRTEAMKHITEEYNKRLPAEGLKLAYIEKALNEVPGWVPIAEHLPEVKKDPYCNDPYCTHCNYRLDGDEYKERCPSCGCLLDWKRLKEFEERERKWDSE